MNNETTPSEIFKASIKNFKNRDSKANKGDYKKLLILGGSTGMAGAPYLAGLSAFRTGVGMVRYIGPESNREILQTLLPEAMYSVFTEDSLSAALSWADLLIAGPGLSTGDEAVSMLRILTRLLKKEEHEKEMIVLDADALNIISKENMYDIFSIKNIVITPHIGEMSRLSGISVKDIKENREKTASDFAKKYNISVVLKDYITVISDGEHTVGNGENTGSDSVADKTSCLSKAGSGDVLCGIITGAKAVTKASVYESSCMGVHLHRLAAALASRKLGENGTLARDIAQCIPEVILSY